MRLQLIVILLFGVCNLHAQKGIVWLPGKIVSVANSVDVSSADINTEKNTLTTQQIYKYDDEGRIVYSEKSYNGHIQMIKTFEYNQANISIPSKENLYSWSNTEGVKKLEFSTEREFLYDNRGSLSEIYEYRIETNGVKNLYAYKSFNYDSDGQIEKYIYAYSIENNSDINSGTTKYDYELAIYKDFVWGKGELVMPKPGTKEWEEWLSNPQSGIKSYTYINRIVSSFEPIGTTEYVYKRTMDYGVDEYAWEEYTSLLGKQLEINTVNYTDANGSHTDRQIIYDGCNDSNDREEAKFSQEIVKETIYISPNEYTYKEYKRNKDGFIQTFTDTNNRNIYNNEYGYLEETQSSGYEYTPGEEKVTFENHTTYSDYKQYGTTAIQAVTNDQSFIDVEDNGCLYNLHGQRVSSDTSLLSPGIYITCGGKKILVK